MQYTFLCRYRTSMYLFWYRTALVLFCSTGQDELGYTPSVCSLSFIFLLFLFGDTSRIIKYKDKKKARFFTHFPRLALQNFVFWFVWK